MKKYIIVFIALVFVASVYADAPVKVVDTKDKASVIKGQVTTKDGYGVWTKDGYPVMIKNVKEAPCR